MLKKVRHLFSDTNDKFIIDVSCCVIPFFLPCILKDSQPAMPQPESLCCFKNAVCPCPWLCKDLSDVETPTSGSGQAHPQRCCSVSVVCVFVSWQALLAVLPPAPAAAPLRGALSGADQGHVHKPSTAWRVCPSQGRGLCPLSPPSWFSLVV